MYRRLQLAGMLLVLCATGYAQVGADQRVCTDLSGKIRVECPPEPQVASPAGGVSTPSVQAPIAKAPPTEPVHKGPLVRVTDKPTPAEDSAPSFPPVVVHKESAPPHYSSLEASLPQNFLADQKNFWSSPLRLRAQDASWLLPLAMGITAVNVADPVIERKLPNGASFIRHSKSFSNYGAAAYAGLVGGAYLLSRATNNDHMRETAVLSGEAAVDTLLISEGAKYLAGRDRPLEGDGTGAFRNGGSSFPSLHSADAFAIATVVAHEYPGHLTQLLAYGGAAAISAARVTGRQHFASDVLVGGALGWFIGRQVYNAHGDREDRELYGTFERAPRERGPRDPAYMGSTYVPLDSWIYSAIDRLAAMGYIDTAFEGLRPWTRMECARMIQDAGLKLMGDGNDTAQQTYQSLRAEFSGEEGYLAGSRNVDATIDSVYTRVTGITGPPLTDGFHFGQTIINDYGRPYREGFNEVTGLQAHAQAGPLAFYVRGEYQHAPFAPALPLSVPETIAYNEDGMPLAPAIPFAAVNRFRLLDAYAAFNIDDWQLSVGKQSLWWGPGAGGPMLFSNNIEPIDMIRLKRVTPWKLPSIFGLLGPIQSEFFFGRLAGYEFVLSPEGLEGQYGRALDPQPIIHGQKISFKPTPNLEFGFSRTTVYGGPGYPLTSHNFFRSLLSSGNTVAGNTMKPGDRRSGLDFSYRLPKLRNYVTFYADGFTEDQYSPIAYADRSVWRAGLYLPRLPWLDRMDLRMEGVYSDNPTGGRGLPPGYFYANGTWRDGYRNQGNLIGSWIGRAGQGAQAWATYHLNPRNDIEVEFRHQKVSQLFTPGGGTLTDFGVLANLWRNEGMGLTSSVQYERWTFPALAITPQNNVTTSVQFTFDPKRWLHK